MTGFQLKDILSSSYGMDDLCEGIKKRLAENNDRDLYERDPRIIADAALDEKFEEETPAEKFKRWGKPPVTLNEILEEFGLVEETKEKLKELDITDDILWYVDPYELVGMLDLKDFPKSKALPKRIN